MASEGIRGEPLAEAQDAVRGAEPVEDGRMLVTRSMDSKPAPGNHVSGHDTGPLAESVAKLAVEVHELATEARSRSPRLGSPSVGISASPRPRPLDVLQQDIATSTAPGRCNNAA